jgi:tight adherence protein C
MADIAYSIVIPLMVFVSVLAIGFSLILAHTQRQMMVKIRLKDSRLVDMPEKSKLGKFSILKVFAQIGNFASHGNASHTLNEQLLRAGFVGSAAPAVYLGIKVILLATGFVLMTVILMPTDLSGTGKITLAAIVAFALFFLPNIFMSAQLKARKEEVRRHLPDAVDLLEICVTSGIGLDMAWHIVSEEIRQVSKVLANAMSLTNFEMNLGARRVEAMRHMAERTGAEELSSLATILIQTERFGTSIADTLRVFANSLREERGFAAEENAEKMAVKLIFPMVLFIFPAVIVTVAGPALIALFRSNFLGSG